MPWLFPWALDALEPTKVLLAITAVLALIVSLAHLLSPPHDGREPPVLKPRIPVIGHLLSIIRHQSTFLSRLAKDNLPIASLPILNGKMYAIWDGNLIQSAYRNKDLSFVPFAVEFAQRELAFDSSVDKIVKESGLMDEFFDAVHKGMAAHYVHNMNANALKYIAKRLEAVGRDDEVVVSNLYLWARDLMTMATCEALYGPENPLAKHPSLMEDLWTFTAGLPLLLLNIFPSIIAKPTYKARERLQLGLAEYYSKNGDDHPDAAGIVKHRAATIRKFGIIGDQVGKMELSLLHVATANTIPTLYWLIAFIITGPKLVQRLREEATAVMEHGLDGTVAIHVDRLAEKCPLLVSCYRETIRINNKALGHRRVMADTTISDGRGRTYLLKKGVDVQTPADTLHMAESAWGPDVREFNPDRFLEHSNNLTSEDIKARRVSYVPFGGGRHLCPGRNFAFAENLGFMVTFLLGYEVSPLDGNWGAFKPPVQDKCALADAVCKPVNNGRDLGMKFKRRAGWESTKWRFVVGSPS